MGEPTISIIWKNLKNEIWKIWWSIDSGVLEKFKNLNWKTGQYDVPIELFQKRTSRTNRVLLRWKILKQNNMNIEWLKTFYGGVCVEFVNDDFYNEENHQNETFKYLLTKIGSDEKISAMLSFRNEDWDSWATIARENLNRFLSENKNNFFPIKRKSSVKYIWKWDNSVWEWNLFYSVKWGSQEWFESHKNMVDPTLFNPAVEYANELVCLDIDITMSFFALHCQDIDRSKIPNYNKLMNDIKEYLKTRDYFDCNLYDYCINHYSLKYGNWYLMDPISVSPMKIEDFKTSGTESSSVICHNEAANKNKFYFDNVQNFLLSPARPQNFFWSKHLSNMMQQNYNLDEYFEEEERRYKIRKKI